MSARRQRGFGAIAALFVLLVLTLLGAAMVTVSNSQQLASAQDVRGSSAYWAARAGLEWGIASATNACAAGNQVLDGFNVAVTCQQSTYSDGEAIRIFQITATASAGGVPGNLGYVERSVSVSVCRLQAAPFAFC